MWSRLHAKEQTALIYLSGALLLSAGFGALVLTMPRGDALTAAYTALGSAYILLSPVWDRITHAAGLRKAAIQSNALPLMAKEKPRHAQ